MAEEKKKKKKRKPVSIDEELQRQVKIFAAVKNKTVSNVVEEAIEMYLKYQEPKKDDTSRLY